MKTAGRQTRILIRCCMFQTYHAMHFGQSPQEDVTHFCKRGASGGQRHIETVHNLCRVAIASIVGRVVQALLLLHKLHAISQLLVFYFHSCQLFPEDMQRWCGMVAKVRKA